MNPNQNDSDLMNQSNVLANYKQQLGQYYQLMVDAFNEIDKDKDSYIDQKELLLFLDSKLPSGKAFDRPLFKKIFEAIDTDLNGKISLYIFYFKNIQRRIHHHLH
jgi:Ca2+-binding EF-hand superfamily protein